MVIFHGKLLVITRGYIYIYCILCSIHSCASAWTWTYHDIRTPGFIDCIDCLSTAQRGEQLDQLAVQHRCIHRGEVPWDHLIMGPVFGTWFLCKLVIQLHQIYTKMVIYQTKTVIWKFFFIKKQRNVHISNFWCQIWVPFQYPPTWDILGTPLTGNLIATYNPC